jgi:hypothetical protein
LLSEGRVEDGALRLGEAEYRVIILPPLASLEAAAWDRLEEFAAGGGVVIACGLLPYEQIEGDNTVSTACAAGRQHRPAARRAETVRERSARTRSARAGGLRFV